MILGIGSDLCRIERIGRSLRRFGDEYLDELFSQDERAVSKSDADLASFYARAFCGKEACAKALGTGISDGVHWRDIEVLQSKVGPTLRLSHGALSQLQRLTPPGYSAVLHLTCMNDLHIAQAFVVISGLPNMDKMPPEAG